MFARFRSSFVLLATMAVCVLAASQANGEQRKVRVAIYQNAPKVFWEEDGRPQGFWIELTDAIAAAENWSVEYVPGTWPQGRERLEAGEVDLLVDVGYSEERAEFYDFNKIVVLNNWAQLYVRDGKTVDTLFDLADMRVAVLRGDISYGEFSETIREFGIPATFVETESFLDCFLKVQQGQADAALISRLFGYRNEGRFDVHRSSIICCPSRLHYALKKNWNKDLAAAIDVHLTQWKQTDHSPYHEAMNHWIGESARSGIPKWLFWVLKLIGALLLVFLAMTLMLRAQIRRRTRELAASEEKYRTIFNNAQVGLFRIDIGNGDVIEANSVMARQYGYDSREEFIREYVMGPNWVDPKERYRMYEEARKNKGTLSNFEAQFYRKDGSVGWYRFSAELFVDQGYMEGVGQDITEQKEMESNLAETEARTLALLDAMPDMMFQFKSNGTILNFKAALGDTFIPPSEFLGKKVTEVLPDFVSEPTMHHLELALKTRQTQVFEYCLPDRDGNGRFFEARITASGSEDAVAVVREITERKQAIDALQESEDKYRTIFETTGTATIIFGEDSVISLANTEFSKLTGYRREEIEGIMPWTAFFRHDATDRLLRHVLSKDGRDNESSGNFETELLDRDKHSHTGVISISKVPGTDQRVASFLDLTEQKHVEAQMFQAEKMAALGQIIAGVAHEINNPNNFITFNLPTVKEYIEGLRPLLDEIAENGNEIEVLNMPLAEWFSNVNKLLDNMQHGSTRITSIVSELKTYIRSHESEAKRPEPIKGVVDHVMTLVGKQIQKMVRHFDVEIEPSLPPVLINAGRIEQVLINMVINAGHAANKDESRIVLRAHRFGDRTVRIQVQDNGCGMTREVAGKIFDPFFTTKGRESGTGLGLAISHRIIEDHGGRIEVESEPGAGSVFSIYLPTFHGE